MDDPTFEKDIKPLFRAKDHDSMLARFDLWSADEVRTNAAAILAALQVGKMPCDGQWSTEDLNLLERWIDGGMPA